MDNLLISDHTGAKAYVVPLRRIALERGNVMHCLKASDPAFNTFGEAYFTAVTPGYVKGWKKHTRMQMQLTVPVGEVKFHLRSEEPQGYTSIVLGSHNYQRLVVDPGLWMAFESASNDENLILNIASIEHDPDEAVDVPLETFSYE